MTTPIPHLCTCPRCGRPAQHETAPNGEGYITCGHCAAITFDATPDDEPTAEFYAQAQAPTPTECANCYSLQPCIDDGEAHICADSAACSQRQTENRKPSPHMPSELISLRAKYQQALADGHVTTAEALVAHAMCQAEAFVRGGVEPTDTAEPARFSSSGVPIIVK